MSVRDSRTSDPTSASVEPTSSVNEVRSNSVPAECRLSSADVVQSHLMGTFGSDDDQEQRGLESLRFADDIAPDMHGTPQEKLTLVDHYFTTASGEGHEDRYDNVSLAANLKQKKGTTRRSAKRKARKASDEPSDAQDHPADETLTCQNQDVDTADVRGDLTHAVEPDAAVGKQKSAMKKRISKKEREALLGVSPDKETFVQKRLPDAEDATASSSSNTAAEVNAHNDYAIALAISEPIGTADPIQVDRGRRSSWFSIRSSIRRASIEYHAKPFGIPLLMLSKPVFVTLQILVAITLFLLFDGQSARGLESALPGWTSLNINRDCEDRRLQVWRLLSYQFSHIDLKHVCLNSITVALAIPQERFQGTVHMLVMFNAGVLGGALSVMVSDVHSSVVGMSAGGYAVIGVHFADLIMNWRAKEYPLSELACFLCMFTFGVVEALILWHEAISHSSHFGGFIGGILTCVGFGRIVKRNKTSDQIQILALIVAFVLVIFCLCWNVQWPPRNIWDPDNAWCWMRQVANKTLFGDWKWHCVRCSDDICSARWLQQRWVERVNEATCLNKLGGWESVDP